MIPRVLGDKLKQAMTKFPVVALMGPRQSGKTTLAKHLFPELRYASLEDLDVQVFAKEDPRGFLRAYSAGAILDEAQRVPELFSYLQGVVDETNQPGQFLLTGSQNFLLHAKVSQSLAGRVYLARLLPLSLEELRLTEYAFEEYEEALYRGFYPRIYDAQLAPVDWYPSYVQTYIERDVRQIKNITDLSTFQRFLKMCAGRIGQLLNLSALALECGITHNTAKAWLSVLEASFIVFLVMPFHKNFNKRLVKMPKLYFYDTGLACSLLGIEDVQQLVLHHQKGALFECMIVSELYKYRYHRGAMPNCYFWRDKVGHEIDCIIESGASVAAVEVKAGKTVVPDFFKELNYWHKLAGAETHAAYVIYGGDQAQQRRAGKVLSWQQADQVFESL